MQLFFLSTFFCKFSR